MDPLTYVGRAQAPLVEEEWQQLDLAITRTAIRVLVGRRLLPVFPLRNVGVMEVQWDVEAEMSEAAVSMYGETPVEDIVTYERKSLIVPLIHKDYRIHWRDLEASRNLRRPLDTGNAEGAALKVAQKEDAMILHGQITGEVMLGIEGFTTVTGRNTEDSCGAWATQPNAVTDIKDCMEELIVDNHFGPYDLILQPSAYLAAHTFIGQTDVMQIDKIRQLIKGQVYVTPELKASDGGTDSAILFEPGAQNADLAVAQDIASFYSQLRDMNHFFKVYDACVPRFKRPTAICELTGIT